MAGTSGQSQTLGGAQTYLELGWTGPHITLGSGYDVAHRSLRPAAVEKFSPLKASQNLKYTPNIHTVTTSDELKTRIKADVSATIPLEGVTVESTSSYLNAIKISDTTLVQIIEETIEEQPTKAPQERLKLKDDASKLLQSNVEAFQDKYGEYLVYGYQSRARFSAVCTIKCSSKEVRDKIKTSLTAKAADIGEITATLDSSTQSNKESISVDVHMEVDRLKDGKAEQRHVFQTDEIIGAFNEFQKDFATTPYMALLCHYSVVDSRFPLPQKQFQYLGGQLAVAYQNLYVAQSELLSSPMVQAAGSSKRITDVCDEIKNLDIGNLESVTAVQRHVQECLSETANWRLRYDLRGDAGKLVNSDFVKDAKDNNVGNWIEAFNTLDWSSGLLGVVSNPKYAPIAGDVTYQHQLFKIDWKVGYQTANLSIGQADKLVIGFMISSYRGDSTNGWFKFEEGGVLQSTVKVSFSSYYDRGCNWGLDVWMIPKLTYEVSENK